MIYLDYNATTPIDPDVVEAMLPYLREHFGNPSSGHRFGVETRNAVEKAREQLAELLGCRSQEVVFTGGGSESDNLAIKGIAYTCKGKGNHIITSKIEHPAVSNTCKFLERNGYTVSYLPVDACGMVQTDDVRNAIRKETILITIMHANNEVGTIQPLKEIGELARDKRIIFHTDAAQSAGKIPVSVKELNIDLLTVAGHKFYAPKGVGALYIRNGINIEPLIHGAQHEEGRRAGTENVAGIVGLGRAAEIASFSMEKTYSLVLDLRDRLYKNLIENIEDVKLNGHPHKRLPNTLNLSFRGVDGAALLKHVEEVAASLGSACHDKTRELSPVLQAMGVGEDFGFGAIRFSLGKWNTAVEIDRTVEIFKRKVEEMRKGKESRI
ncbi:MAG: cysteine desulfurase family protein [Spirochaetota bacterium]